MVLLLHHEGTGRGAQDAGHTPESCFPERESAFPWSLCCSLPTPWASFLAEPRGGGRWALTGVTALHTEKWISLGRRGQVW